MDQLHEKGCISTAESKTLSIVIGAEGLARSKESSEKLFAK